MTKTDLNWLTNGVYYRLVPNTPAGEYIFNEICKYYPDAEVPFHAWPSVKTQIKEAGYTLRKLPEGKPATKEEIDQLLSELET